MKKYFSLIVVCLTIGCSSNDWDLDTSRHSNWNEALNECIEDYSRQLSSSGIVLQERKLIDASQVDSMSFWGTKDFCFPVYYKTFENFDPVPASFLQSDTITTHVSISTIKHRIREILVHPERYEYVTLKWNCDDVFTFNTISVFDKHTHELIYDNLLGNIIDDKVLNNRHAVLTKAEIVVTIDESEGLTYDNVFSVSYGENNNPPTEYSLNVKVWGYWKRQYNFNENNELISYWFDWYNTYALDTESWESNMYGLYSGHLFSNQCYTNKVSFKYLIWLGNGNCEYSTYSFSNLVMPRNQESTGNTNGVYKACHIEYTPQHPDYYFASSDDNESI